MTETSFSRNTAPPRRSEAVTPLAHRNRMKRILERSFHYVPSYQTDLRKTFERIRREQRAQHREAPLEQQGPAQNVLALPARKASQ